MHARVVWSSRLLLGLLVGAALSVGLAAGAEPEKVHKANYAQAFKFSPEFVRQFAYDTGVTPNWIGKTDQFWYSYRTAGGTQFWRVNPATKSKEPLFDHVKLAGLLSETAKKPVDVSGLSLSRGSLSDDGAKFKFVFDDYQYEYEIIPNKLTKGARAPRQQFPVQGGQGRGRELTEQQRQMIEQLQRQQEQQQQQDQQQQQQNQNQQQQQQNQQQTQGQAGTGRGAFGDYRNFSPDKKRYLYVYKHNLYLAEADKEKEALQLTTDGEEDRSFAGGGGFGGFGQRDNQTERQPDPERKSRPNATWSSDSKAFYVTRTDQRGVKELFLVDSIAEPRPRLEKYKYPMPGEEKTRKQELYYCYVEERKLKQMEPKWKDERYVNLHWGKDPSHLRFLRRDRLQRNIEFCNFDVKSGKCQCLIEEGIENGNLEFQNARYLEDTDEMIWWSERTGWGHFYLYGRDGKIKNAITTGPWRASSIVSVDTKNRTLYLRGNAREAGENVYYQHLYAVRLDGTGLALLDPGAANHTSTMSPTYQVLVDNTSRIDEAPTSCVRDAAGRKIMDLEVCDLSRLKETGWQLPKTFVVKAADGVTDLYGNLWFPFDMDPKKKYPIIAHVYPGPQTEGVTHTFSTYSTNMQLAQLGFIVVQVGHRGGTPTRSKAYHRYGYNNLRDYALEDKKSAIEQLAIRHPFIDIERVGIYGHSGGGFMSAAALLQKPYNDFFKAAVASAGNHDNNIYNDNWSERYHGLKEVPVDQAKDAATTAANTTNSTQQQSTNGGQGGRRRRPPIDLDEFDMREHEIEEGIIWDDEENDPLIDQSTQEQLEAIKKELVALGQKLASAKGDEVAQIEKQLNDAKAKLAKVSADLANKGTAKTDTAKKEEAKTSTEKKVDAAVKTAEGVATAVVKAAVTKFEIKVPTNAELAANLKGSLLLVHGEIDNNVHPANTIRLVDALIKANKRFDMLILPGQRHGFGSMTPYFNQRMWDFFSDHLLGDRPSGADILEKRNGHGK